MTFAFICSKNQLLTYMTFICSYGTETSPIADLSEICHTMVSPVFTFMVINSMLENILLGQIILTFSPMFERKRSVAKT